MPNIITERKITPFFSRVGKSENFILIYTPVQTFICFLSEKAAVSQTKAESESKSL